MVRKFKFRGKSKRTGEWFYGNLYEKDTSGRTQIRTPEKGCLDIDSQTVGQYTGVKDANGVEIYEGDILRSDSYPFTTDEEKDDYFGQVYWCEGYLAWYVAIWKNPKSGIKGVYHGIDIALGEIDTEMVEVIGNVCDNLELIESNE